MNIPRILESLDEWILESLDECDRAQFCEALGDATHYVEIALEILPAPECSRFPELCAALNHLNDLNDEIQEHLAAEPMRGCHR